MKTSELILTILKNEGALSAQILADKLDMTTMGVRKHLQLLENKGSVGHKDVKAKRGRPNRFWSLTQKSNVHFEDGHQVLTVQLIDSVKKVFGEQGLKKLIQHREIETHALYQSIISKESDIVSKLTSLAQLRNAEGYMSSVSISTDNESQVHWLYENHCPISNAAQSCPNFCDSELRLFQTLLKEDANVSREEHIIEGSRRCAYKITVKH